MQSNKATIGTVSHGTLRNEDLLSTFARELEHLTTDYRTRSELELIADADAVTDFDSEHASEIVHALFDALDNHAPEYCYFGSHEGDGSDFGFWPSMDSIEELPKFNDLADVPDDIDDDYCIVNDHGNVSLYSADGKPIWSIV
jgi:hypothetical protein